VAVEEHRNKPRPAHIHWQRPATRNNRSKYELCS
jgi:hypothetical protein